MKKKINGVLYDTATAPRMPETESMVLFQTSLLLTPKRQIFWTVDHFKGDIPTSMTIDLPVGVIAFKEVSFRQNCSWAARRLGC